MSSIDVFISRKSNDARLAKELYDYLAGLGLVVFDSDENLPRQGNSDYRKEIDNALSECKHLVVVGSSYENIFSSWVEAEWGFYINEKRAGRKQGNILTLITDGLEIANLPASLRYYQVIQFDPANFQKIASYLGKDIKATGLVPPSFRSATSAQNDIPLSNYVAQGNMKVSEVPQSIRFGTDIVTIPTFQKAGLDEKLYCRGTIKSALRIGQWINRDDELLAITLHVYSMPQKPKYFWSKDLTYPISFSLKSPVSGLVIGLQDEYIGYYAQYAMGKEPLVYGNKSIFPVLLLPKDEPPLNIYRLEFYNEYSKVLNQEWRLLQFSHRDKGYTRFSESFSESELRFVKGEVKLPALLSTFVKDQWPLESNIQNLRTGYLDLRDKLVHLVR